MSVEIKYKGNTIASASTDTTKTLKTSGKYCEADIEVINTQDGGITPSGNINITENGTYDVTEYASANVNVSGGGTEVKISERGFMYIPPKLIYPDQESVLDLSSLVYAYMYSNCTDITSAYFGKNIKWGEISQRSGYSILSGSNCETVEVASLNTAYDMFWNASALKTAIIKPECQKLMNYTFESCNALTTVIIEGDRIITLANINAFSGANNALIYVPDNLVDDYKSATNWSSYANRIFPMSDLEV